MLQKIFGYFQSRSVGFYLCCGAAVISVVEAILYKNAVTDARYYSDASFYLALFAFLPFAALVPFRVTERYAPAALAVMIFLSFMTFLAPQSNYIGDLFYGAAPSGKYIATIVLIVIGTGLAIAGIFMRMSKTLKPKNGETAQEEVGK